MRYDELFGDRAVELLTLPEAFDALDEAVQADLRGAVDAGRLAIHTREALPYGLALFDDRVGIAGYDETGTMRVFVDSASELARTWAERVWSSYLERSEPLDAA